MTGHQGPRMQVVFSRSPLLPACNPLNRNRPTRCMYFMGRGYMTSDLRKRSALKTPVRTYGVPSTVLGEFRHTLPYKRLPLRTCSSLYDLYCCEDCFTVCENPETREQNPSSPPSSRTEDTVTIAARLDSERQKRMTDTQAKEPVREANHGSAVDPNKDGVHVVLVLPSYSPQEQHCPSLPSRSHHGCRQHSYKSM